MEISKTLENEEILENIRRAKCASCVAEMMITDSDGFGEHEMAGGGAGAVMSKGPYGVKH